MTDRDTERDVTLLPVSLHNRGLHRVSPGSATLSALPQHLPRPWSYSDNQDDSEFQADLLQLSLVSCPLSELPERLDLKEIKFESWFLGPQTLYLKQQATSVALEGRKWRRVVPSKCILEPVIDILCFYNEVQWEINFSCSPYCGFCFPMPGDRMELSLPRGLQCTQSDLPGSSG